MQKILIIDDDQDLGELLKTYLSSEGFSVTICLSGDDGLKEAVKGSYELLILDVMLPGINGFDVLRQIRQQSQVPVIMLTARGDEIDRIVGLELGADDYLPKPFNPRELVARIKAIFRRISNKQLVGDGEEILTVGDVEMHISGRSVRRCGESVDLTEVEFQILEILLRSAGKVVQRQDLALQALGRRLEFDDRSLDVHISNLRKKIGHRLGNSERIRTIRGVGYLYATFNEQTC
ncbi:MAG: response regulator transcription factor [Candidatus Riflebacteria bacterium]|nr:response regulator transcription factor [Candidatus Riflebacteria bacterium]